MFIMPRLAPIAGWMADIWQGDADIDSITGPFSLVAPSSGTKFVLSTH